MAAVDSLSEPPAIWFVGLFRAKPAAPALAVRIEDRGDKLVQAVNVLEANGLSKETGEADGGLHSHQYYIAADKRSGVLAAGGVNAVGPDGLWYSRAQSMGAKVNWIVRRDPKNDVYVPFEVDGKQASLWWSAKNKWVHNGKPVIGIEIDYHAHGPHGFQSPFDVAPNGDIYAMSTTAKTHLENMTKAGIFNTGKTEAFHHMVLVYGPDGKLKSPAALTGLWDTDGLRVGRSGAVYVVQGVHALDQALPDGLAAGGKFHGSRWGSLVKFNSAFDKYPVGRMVGMWEGKDAEGATHKLGGRKVKFENALWTYGGVSPVSAAPGGCTCLKSSFDLDLYERSFVPAAQTCSVNVIDSNGNVAARLGGYGNLHDLITAKKLAFDIPRSVAVTDEAMWVHDCQHRAVVKAKLSYHTEETVGLDGRASISTSPPVSSAPVVPKTSAAPVAPAAEKPVSEEAPALSAAARAPAPRPAARDAEAAARSLLLMGMNYKRAGRAGQARKYFQRVLDEHPNTEFAARAKREQASL